jgi:predicted dehydrogenase
VSGSAGSATWDGENAPLVELVGQADDDGAAATAADAASDGADAPLGDAPEEIAGALAEFVHSLRTGDVPSGDVHSNILSLAMVEAAVRSAASGQRVLIDDVLEDAYAQARADESREDVLAVLEGWGSAAAGLGR